MNWDGWFDCLRIRVRLSIVGYNVTFDLFRSFANCWLEKMALLLRPLPTSSCLILPAPGDGFS